MVAHTPVASVRALLSLSRSPSRSAYVSRSRALPLPSLWCYCLTRSLVCQALTERAEALRASEAGRRTAELRAHQLEAALRTVGKSAAAALDDVSHSTLDGTDLEATKAVEVTNLGAGSSVDTEG